LLLSVFRYDKTLEEANLLQSEFTVQGIKYAFVFLPLLFMVFALWFTARFPMDKKEFDIVKKEIERRKGLESSPTTEEERIVCERVTGSKFEELWGNVRERAV